MFPNSDFNAQNHTVPSRFDSFMQSPPTTSDPFTNLRKKLQETLTNKKCFNCHKKLEITPVFSCEHSFCADCENTLPSFKKLFALDNSNYSCAGPCPECIEHPATPTNPLESKK